MNGSTLAWAALAALAPGLLGATPTQALPTQELPTQELPARELPARAQPPQTRSPQAQPPQTRSPLRHVPADSLVVVQVRGLARTARRLQAIPLEAIEALRDSVGPVAEALRQARSARSRE
jgi:hypothetical protein